MNGPAGEVPILVHVAREDRTLRDLGPGHRARRRHARALRGARPRPDPGRRPARRDRARRARRLVSPARALRHAPPRRRARARARARRARLPDVPVPALGARLPRAALPRGVADERRGVPAAAPRGRAADEPRAGRRSSSRLVDAERAAKGSREAKIRAARDSFYRGRAGGGDRALPRGAGARRERPRARGPAARGRPRRATRARSRSRSPRDYRGARVWKCGPWSQGPGVPAAAPPARGLRARATRARTPPTRCTGMVECAKLAFADREAQLRRPALRRRAARRSCSRTPTPKSGARWSIRARASLELRPGLGRLPAGWPRIAGQPAPSQEPQALAAARGRGDTTHLDAVDREGNAVCGDALGRLDPVLAGDPVARLPDRHARADVRARSRPPERARAGQAPAHHALAVARAARRRAHARVRHAGRRPAGPVDAAVLPERGATSARATCRARSTRRRCTRTTCPTRSTRAPSQPGVVAAESRIAAEVLAELERRGHRVRRGGPWEHGRVLAVARDPASGVCEAAASPRFAIAGAAALP